MKRDERGLIKSNAMPMKKVFSYGQIGREWNIKGPFDSKKAVLTRTPQI